MPSFSSFAAALLLVLASSPRTGAQTEYLWTGSSGNWSSAANWTPVGVPGASDTAVIRSGSVLLNTTTSIQRLQLEGGSIIGDGSQWLTILESGSWLAGEMSGVRVRIDPTCTLTMEGAGGKMLLNSGVITNAGTLVWTGGTWRLENNPQVRNLPGGVEDVRFDGALMQTGAGTSTFRNEGLYRKSAGPGTHTIQIVQFINSGTVSAGSGAIRFAGTELRSAGSGNSILADAGAAVLVETENAGFTDSTLAGTGLKSLRTGIGSLEVNGVNRMTNTVFAGGNWSGTAEILGELEWQAGTLSPRLNLPVGSHLRLTGNARKPLVNSGGITNAGTVTWAGGRWDLENNVSFVNLPGGVVDVQFDGSMLQNGPGTSTFLNSGTYRKSGGTGTNTIQIVQFVQGGNLEILSGVIRLVGDLVQPPHGSLRTRIGGTIPGTEHGQLQVTGSTSLAGRLDLERSGGFQPLVNQSFQILTARSRTGVFGAVTGNALGAGLFFTPRYASNGARIEVVDGTATLVRPAWVSGRFQFELQGLVEGRYRIEAATNLLDWVSVATNQVPGSGVSEFRDLDSATYPYRFYRGVFLPF